MSRRFVDLVDRMSDDIDVVVSGHTHAAYNCTIDGKLVTSASSAGRLITDIDLRVDRSDGAVVSKVARNVVVTRDVPKDPTQTALLERYRPIGDKVGNRVVGSIAASLTRQETRAGESALGDVIADAFLEAAKMTPGANAEIGMWNPGGIRADLIAQPGAAPTPVRYAQVFSVMPFGNELIVKSITGEVLLRMLEQQFGPDRRRIMQVSNGFTYMHDPSRPTGHRVIRDSVRINGVPLDLKRQYRLATSNFLWDSGDGLNALVAGTDPLLIGVDYELLASYFSRHSPVQPGPQNRIHTSR
jgi:5'-nucleotidase